MNKSIYFYIEDTHSKFYWSGSKFVENEENAMTYKINKPLGFLVMNKQHIPVVKEMLKIHGIVLDDIKIGL